MRAVLAVVGLLALAGCGKADPPALIACENAIKATLVSPASYKRVSVDGEGEVLSITYDAANSYNALLRIKGRCFYDSKTGKADWFKTESSAPD